MSMGMWGSGWADPSTGQIWPLVDPATGAVRGAGTVSARVVRAIPGVGRAMGVLAGRMAQMPLTLWAGVQKIEPVPELLVRPDPAIDYPTLMNAMCWDYWIHGNALLYDTVHDDDGRPLASMWLPAERTNAWQDPRSGAIVYEHNGVILDTWKVRHVRRQLDPWRPWRGIGVLEQHMRTWAKVSDQQAYESSLLQDAGVPSVAIVIGNPDLSQEEAEETKATYKKNFSGPRREPIVLPSGSEVAPLAWSPVESQMVEAQKMSRGDIADIFDLDRYYLGVADGSFNYKTASSMSLALIKDTLGEHIKAFEATLTAGWCEPGQQIQMDTGGVLQDDMAGTVGWLRPAVDAGILTIDEARARLGYPPLDDEQRGQVAEQRSSAAMIMTLGEDL